MTQPPPAAPLGFETLLSSSWAMFKRNWIVSAPFVMVAFVMIVLLGVFVGVAVAVGVFAALRNGQIGGGTVALLVIFYLLFIVLAFGLSIWAYAATFGMAEAVWERGTATFADGNAAFRSRGVALVVAFIGLLGLGFVSLILAIPTLFLSVLALALFTMYVLPSVVAGRRGGFEAIAESFRLVRYNFATSAITAVVLYAISYGISFIGAIPMIFLQFSFIPTSPDAMPQIPPIPLLVFAGGGYIFVILASLAYTGFYAVAITGLYRSLVAQLPPAPAAHPLPAAPGTP